MVQQNRRRGDAQRPQREERIRAVHGDRRNTAMKKIENGRPWRPS
jgi:hypothetical protein